MSITGVPHLPPRDSAGHKGRYGRALIVGGSPGMAGAVALAGIACLRGGAGLVTLGTARSLVPAVAGFEPSYMTLGLPEDRSGQIALSAGKTLRQWSEKSQCIAIGPGLGRSADLQLLLGKLYHELPIPLVIDADGLNLLAAQRDDLAKPEGPRILTPHLGEFRRLTGRDDLDMNKAREIAPEVAAQWGSIVVLKGAETLVTDGAQSYINQTGNPGLGTGGTGDVLTGLITAIVCQGLEPFEAACLGVYLHGLAGDLAADRLSPEGMIASDVAHAISAAWIAYRKSIGKAAD